VYATKSWKGINVFRKVEEKAAPEQERVGAIAKQRVKDEGSGQSSLFEELPIAPGLRSFEDEQRYRLKHGREVLEQIISSNQRVGYKELSAEVQQIPLVWESYVKDWLVEMADRGEIKIENLKGRARRPNPDCTIVWLG
jgi:hypothetical protein